VEGQPERSRLNVYQMFDRVGGAGFFVRRNSWRHPRTVARVVSVAGLRSGTLPGAPPYHGNPPVEVVVSYQGQVRRERLRCPGSYAYELVPRPPWWHEPPY